MTSEAATSDGRQFVKFTFYRVDPAWRRLDGETRLRGKKELASLLVRSAETMTTRTYSLVGTRADADFIVWQIAEELAPIQDFAAALLKTQVAGYLTVAHSFLSLTRSSIYTNPRHPGAASARERISPVDRTHLFVYPFVKTRAWYRLPLEERQRMMSAHIEVGHRYHSVKINTTYSYGLDDQEFVLAFEADDPKVFLDLVMELRETEASAYTLRDTPTFTCTRMEIPQLLDHVGL